MSWVSGRVIDNSLTAAYNVFMIVWATLFLEFWKRRSAEIGTVWHTRSAEEEVRDLVLLFSFRLFAEL